MNEEMDRKQIINSNRKVLFSPIYWKLKKILVEQGLEALFNMHAKHGIDPLKEELQTFVNKNNLSLMKVLSDDEISIIHKYPRDFEEYAIDELAQAAIMKEKGLIKSAVNVFSTHTIFPKRFYLKCEPCNIIFKQVNRKHERCPQCKKKCTTKVSEVLCK